MHAREIDTTSACICSVDSLLQSVSYCGHREDTTPCSPQHTIGQRSSRVKYMELGA